MPKDPEDLLWELSSLELEDDGPIPDDEALRRYRAGEMTPQEAAGLESALACSRQARRRLAELSGIQPPQPSPALRTRVTAALPPRKRRLPPVWRRAGLSAAAALLAVVAAQLLWVGGPSPGALPEYQIQASGIAEERSGPVPGVDAIRAYPETRVRIRLTARNNPSEAVGYALYRLQGNQLERLAVTFRKFRGAALLDAPGSELAPWPGSWQLFAVAAWESKLPSNQMLRPGENPEDALRESSAGQVFSLRLDLLPTG